MPEPILYEADGGAFLQATRRGVRRYTPDGAPLYAAPVEAPTEWKPVRLFYGNPGRVRAGFSMEVAVAYRLDETRVVVWRAVMLSQDVAEQRAGGSGGSSVLVGMALHQKGAPSVAGAMAAVRTADPTAFPSLTLAEMVRAKAFPKQGHIPSGAKTPVDVLRGTAANLIAAALFAGAKPDASATEVVKRLAIEALTEHASLPSYVLHEDREEGAMQAEEATLARELADLADLGF